MDKKHRLLRILPYASAIVLFLVLAMAYFAPQLSGKKLNMGDITQYEGMSRDIKQQQAAGQDPQWTGAAFGGMPAYMINIRYPAMIIKDWSQAAINFIGQPAVLLFLAMLCFWAMLLFWGISPLVAIVPALAYGFSTYSVLIIGAGHITKMLAFAYAPLLVGGVVYSLRGGRQMLGMLLTALFAALQIGANHPQITYYFGIILIAAWINELFVSARGRNLKRFTKGTLLLFAAAIMAVGANFAPLYYTWEHSSETTRGGSELKADSQSSSKGLDIDYATAWSYGVGESVNMFIPNFRGGSSSGGFSGTGAVAESLRPYNARQLAAQLPAYWGDQPMTAGPTYIGAAVIFLAVLGMFLLKGREKWWIAAVALFGLLLSWGSNFMWFTKLMFDILPGYDKFRAVSTALVIVQWCIPALAALLLSRLWSAETDKKRFRKGFFWSLGLTTGVALFFALLGGKLFSFSAPYDSQMGLPQSVIDAMQSERASMLRADSLRSLVYVLLSAAAVWFLANGKIRKEIALAALGAIVAADLIGVDTRYLSWSDFSAPRAEKIVPSEADRQILQDSSLGYRVANFSVSTFNDATTSYFHRSVGGYHGAKLSRYQDLIDRQLSRGNAEAYNMLNTKYFITTDKETGSPVAQLNAEADGAAWFVEGVVWADSPEAEINALDTLKTKSSAVVDRRFAKMLDNVVFGSGEINLVRYQPNKLVYRYRSPEGGVAVFSEIYYNKGWTAYVDGRQADYFRADYVLRGMKLPAGDHTVEFRFRAPDFDIVEAVTLFFSAAILGGLALYAASGLAKKAIARKKRNKKNESTEQ